jgi:AraC-like DNA-binding protein
MATENAPASADALGDVLRLIRLEGCVYFLSDFAPPWGMTVETGAVALFHVVVRGQCRLATETGDHLLSAGDIAVFPRGSAHVIMSDRDAEARPGPAVVQAIRQGANPFTGAAPSARILCGHFAFDRSVPHPLLGELPDFIHVKGLEQRYPGWLDSIAPILVREAESGAPGADTISERLAEVLLIQVLRAHMTEQAPSRGFLAAIHDSRISRALKAIHAQPEEALSVESLAKSAGMSRSSFAEHFRELVGMTPMAYLTQWRMLRAGALLVTTRLPVADVAESVGYSSEAAFNRSFKRTFELSPAAYRRSH